MSKAAIPLKAIFIVFFIFCPLFGLSVDLNAEFTAKYSQKTGTFFISGVTVVDMDSSQLLAEKDVLIRNGKIETIVLHTLNSTPPKSATVIDGRGKYLLPGYIDCHVHLSCVDDIWLLLVNGVTTLRIMSGSEEMLALKKQIQSHAIVGPRMFVAGPIFEDTQDSYYDYIETPNDCTDAVQECKNLKYDFFKIGTVGNKEYYSAIAKKCAELHYTFVGHSPKWATAADLVESKQYSLEHLLYFPIATNEDIRILAQSQVWLCPTLSIYSSAPVNRGDWTSHPQYRYISKSILKEWEKYPKIYAGNVGELQKVYSLWAAGARLVAGTDCRIDWVVPGFAIHSEIAELGRYGIPPMEVLRIATANGADMLNIGDKTGRIRAGMEADMVLLNSNPLSALSATSDIAAVFCNGLYLSKKDIDYILERIASVRN